VNGMLLARLNIGRAPDGRLNILRAMCRRFSDDLPRKTAVAMSGGVDSSVAAALLVERCLRDNVRPADSVVGLHMSNWDVDEESEECDGSQARDWNDVRDTCAALGIKCRRVSFVKEYWNEVFLPFVEGFSSEGGASTPNPDVGCNARIKFGVMRRYAMEMLGADAVATGHYARIWNRRGGGGDDDMPESVREGLRADADGGLLEDVGLGGHWIRQWGRLDHAKTGGNLYLPILLAGKDAMKDQSYFLSGVSGSSFHNVSFPLGCLEKESAADGVHSVRDIAASARLPAASKRDSMGICFIGRRKFSDFLSQYVEPPPPGNFVCIDTGRVVGLHGGKAAFFTVGQKAKIGGASAKWFVAGGAAALAADGGRTVFVCKDTHHSSLYADELSVRRDAFNWIGGAPPPPLVGVGGRILALCRIRHQQPLARCEVRICDITDRLLVRFYDAPMRGVCAGQVAALYVAGGEVCLGGGPILSPGLSYFDRGLSLPSYIHPAGLNDRSVNRRRERNNSK